MDDREDQEGLFLRCIGDQEVPNSLKSDQPRCEIRSNMALIRERRQAANRLKNLLYDTISRIRIMSRNVFPNIVKVCIGLVMKNKPTHDCR